MIKTHERRRIVILGAAGRDFHNFNVAYRDDPAAEVVAITATQIPGIAGRRYPPELAGPLYPDGIPILPEDALEKLCRDSKVDQAVFAYSDVRHVDVMHMAARCLAAGCDFLLLGPDRTMLQANKPVVAITAIRTGCGKSQTGRYVARHIRERGLRTAVLRHPMPYGDLAQQRVQRFASRADLDAAACTNEEREEYEPHIADGGVIYAGVDYAEILAAAEAEADVILWEGGNNDFSFVRPDLHIVLADALRPGQADAYHPGEAVLRTADVIVVTKVDSALAEEVEQVIGEVQAINGDAPLVRAASPVRLDDPDAVQDCRVLVIEDGPTITHGGQAFGAGLVAARAHGAKEIIDPRHSATPVVQQVYARYPHIGPVLPNVGYSQAQRNALKRTIANAGPDIVIVATPIDPAALIPQGTRWVRARYDYADAGEPRLTDLVDRFLENTGLSQC